MRYISDSIEKMTGMADPPCDPTLDDVQRFRRAGMCLAVYALEFHSGEHLDKALNVSAAISHYCNQLEIHECAGEGFVENVPDEVEAIRKEMSAGQKKGTESD